MAKTDDYKCKTCAKFGHCKIAIYMALAGEVIYCGKWEEAYKTTAKEVQ